MNKQLIQKELEKVKSAIQHLVDTNEDVRMNAVFNRLYLVQQSLQWVLDPESVKSPCDLVVNSGSTFTDASFIDKPEGA